MTLIRTAHWFIFSWYWHIFNLGRKQSDVADSLLSRYDEKPQNLFSFLIFLPTISYKAKLFPECEDFCLGSDSLRKKKYFADRLWFNFHVWMYIKHILLQIYSKVCLLIESLMAKWLVTFWHLQKLISIFQHISKGLRHWLQKQNDLRLNSYEWRFEK